VLGGVGVGVVGRHRDSVLRLGLGHLGRGLVGRGLVGIVLGGLDDGDSFGVLGLFVGPVILAATYKLTQAWVAEDWSGTTPAGPAAADTKETTAGVPR